MTNQTQNTTQLNKPETRILLLFTRTPLHVGAGTSVGAIDLPVIRERHTGFPIIPGSSLKGTFADEWLEWKTKNGEDKKKVLQRSAIGRWLFGETEAENAAAGALQFSEARLLAFPLRSAKGGFAWITCPLILRRAVRDGVVPSDAVKSIQDPGDHQAYFGNELSCDLAMGNKIILEEYTFERFEPIPTELTEAFEALLPEDLVWTQVGRRLVILSNGMMSYFAVNACEVATHVKINDETGTAAEGALFNQENVPSETLFYSVLYAFRQRKKIPEKTPDNQGASEPSENGFLPAEKALEEFQAKLQERNFVFQFGGDATTGLGYCTVSLRTPIQPNP